MKDEVSIEELLAYQQKYMENMLTVAHKGWFGVGRGIVVVNSWGRGPKRLTMAYGSAENVVANLPPAGKRGPEVTRMLEMIQSYDPHTSFVTAAVHDGEVRSINLVALGEPWPLAG